MSKALLRKLIAEELDKSFHFERDSIRQERAKKEFLNRISGYVDKGYFLHFANVEKLGIKPLYNWGMTPQGIYAYELTRKVFREFNDLDDDNYGRHLVFGATWKYVAIFKINDLVKEKHILYISGKLEEDITQEQYERCVVESLRGLEEKLDVQDISGRWMKSLNYQTFSKQLYVFIYSLANSLIQQISRESEKHLSAVGERVQQSLTTRKLFEKLGFVGVVDRGTGTISRDIPQQAVFFRASKDIISDVEFFNNPYAYKTRES